MSILNNNWFNINSTRRYPVDDFATGASDEGFELPNDIITDIRIRFPRSAGKFVSISSINCSKSIVTVALVAHEYHPSENIASSSAAAEVFQPLAIVSLPKPVTPNTPYQLTPLTNGVFGWIVFGEGIEKEFLGRFSNAEQALLIPKLAYSYGSYTVTSLSIIDDVIKLTKDVTLRGIGDLKVEVQNLNILGVLGEVKAMVFKLENTSSTSNLFEKYKGKCHGRPESESCKKISVEFINGMQPDCDGNININFERNGLSQKELINTSLVGIALEMPLGLAEACTRNDYLPDQFGNLPNEYPDVCAAVAEEEGNPDAIANTGNLINANPSFSMTPVDVTSIPYVDTMAFSPGDPVPYRFEILKGSFQYESTPYNRGFPEGSTGNGMAVTSPGSRFVAVWNDHAAYDHTIYKDIATPVNGARVSTTLTFKQLATLGAGGVILDFITSYAASCDKYVKSYLIGVLDFSSKRLKILYWNGFSFTVLASSEVISNLAPGEWYSLDFQKDTSDILAGKIKYKLRLYTAESYWTDTTISSSLWDEVGSTPYPGYSVPIDSGLLGSVEVYKENSGVDSYCGVGTVTGSPVFSYFFVG
jgi:hypothetical protein